MKMKVLFLLLIGVPLILASCGKDDTKEACKYQTAKDLDAGKYDAVLESACADDLQLGAAYFGKAGYDITVIIKSFVSAGSNENNEGNQGSDLDMFMSSSVTGAVTGEKLTNLKKADGYYKKVADSGDYDAEQKKDAEFYSGVVNAFRSVSLMKTIIDSNGSGSLSTCDINNNQTPDDVDAVSCALYTAVSQSCAGVKSTVIATVNPPLNVPDTETGHAYKGVVIQADNLGGPGSTDAACTSATYRKLIHGATLVTTSSTMCAGSDGGQWPCPIMNESDQPLSLVTAVQESLTTASDSIAASIGANSGDVAKAIDEINNGACGADKVCTEAEIAQYLQNL